MTISIVSAEYSKDDHYGHSITNSDKDSIADGSSAVSVTNFPGNAENINNINDDSSRLNAYHPEEPDSTEENDVSDQTSTITKKSDTIVVTNDADTIFSASASDQKVKNDNIAEIPNMYIQADAEAYSKETPEQQENNNTGFDMDELLTDTTETAVSINVPETDKMMDINQVSTTGEIFSPATQNKAERPFDDKQTNDNRTKSPVNKKGSLMKGLAVMVGGLFGVLILRFLVKTMFPLGINDGQISISDPDPILVVDEDIAQEDPSAHSADTKTEQEIVREELQEYTQLGTSFYQLGRDLKDRNMVRYALYVEKKSQDLIDLLASDPNMDTKDIVVYFAQFDDYLRTLKERQADLGVDLPSSPTNDTGSDDESIDVQYDASNDYPIDMELDNLLGPDAASEFNPLLPPTDYDTTSGSFTTTESEQSQLSDG